MRKKESLTVYAKSHVYRKLYFSLFPWTCQTYPENGNVECSLNDCNKYNINNIVN